MKNKITNILDKLFKTPIGLKFLVLLILFSIFYIRVNIEYKEYKQDEIVLVDVNENNSMSHLSQGTVQTNENMYVYSKYKTVYDSDTLDKAFDKLYNNNRYIIDEMLRVPLKYNQDKTLAPYYMVEDTTYEVEDLRDIFLKTYTPEYVDMILLNESKPFYFETDGRMYYNANNMLKDVYLKDIDWATMEYKIINQSENGIEYSIKTREIVEEGVTEDIELIATIIKTPDGYRLTEIVN